jgi:transitional endoplasmic reticulum ATPase
MGEQKISDEAGRREVFQGFKDHFNGHRKSTELTVLELIRKAYPDFNVTCALASKCDFFGYAKAGHATTTRDVDELYDATRSWKSPGPRLEGKPGGLRDHVRFGRHKYEWHDYEYLLYEVEYSEFMRATKLFFILYPHGDQKVSGGDVSPTDELLLAVGGVRIVGFLKFFVPIS